MFNSKMHEKIKECMKSELPEIQKLYEENKKLQSIQQREDVKTKTE